MVRCLEWLEEYRSSSSRRRQWSRPVRPPSTCTRTATCRGNATAIKIGESAYGQNCARCHGLEAISGGIAPDLRYLDVGEAGDEWFIQRFQHGSVRDGKVYMPPMGDVLGQKAGWAIRSWLDTKHSEE